MWLPSAEKGNKTRALLQWPYQPRARRVEHYAQQVWTKGKGRKPDTLLRERHPSLRAMEIVQELSG
jgi:hypothetical protein